MMSQANINHHKYIVLSFYRIFCLFKSIIRTYQCKIRLCKCVVSADKKTTNFFKYLFFRLVFSVHILSVLCRIFFIKIKVSNWSVALQILNVGRGIEAKFILIEKKNCSLKSEIIMNRLTKLPLRAVN